MDLSTIRPNPAMDQHFLVSRKKIQMIMDALQIDANDIVLELGAGAGTIAEAVPPCRQLVLVELDHFLCTHLRHQVKTGGLPSETLVLEADALEILNHQIDPSVKIISSLPAFLTDQILKKLTQTDFSAAAVALPAGYEYADARHLCTLCPDDFLPPQDTPSEMILLRP